jgi:hypothetical protein
MRAAMTQLNLAGSDEEIQSTHLVEMLLAFKDHDIKFNDFA